MSCRAKSITDRRVVGSRAGAAENIVKLVEGEVLPVALQRAGRFGGGEGELSRRGGQLSLDQQPLNAPVVALDVGVGGVTPGSVFVEFAGEGRDIGKRGFRLYRGKEVADGAQSQLR